MKTRRRKQPLFRVYVGQVNQTCVQVRAKDADTAAEKGYRIWRRQYAHAGIVAIEPADSPESCVAPISGRKTQ